MGDQWNQPQRGQSQWGQPPMPNQTQWGQPPMQRQPPMPNQTQWGQPPMPNQGRQGQPPIYPGQFQPAQPLPKEKSRKGIIIGASFVLILSIMICGLIGSQLMKSSAGDETSTQANPDAQQTQVVQPTATPTPTPLPTPNPAQVEATYKASTTSTTVDNLDKDGSADQGKEVHFVCELVSFVKDSSGNTVGANVTTQPSYSGSFVQVAFPAGTDLSHLNENDVLEVWGTDEGVFSGANAFGATIQEVGVTAKYMTDQTTNYQAGG